MNGNNMGASEVFQSLLITIISLYIIVIAPLTFKAVKSIRSLGAFLLIYPLLLVNALYFQSEGVRITIIAISGLLFFNFSQQFLTEQFPRGFKIHLLLISLFIITIFSFGTSPLMKAWAAVILVSYVALSRQVILSKTRAKGVSLFRNPGRRVGWFRNFSFLQLLIALLLLFHITAPVTIGSLPLTSLIFANIILVYSQIFDESGFFSAMPGGQKYAKSSLTPEQKFSILNRLERIMVEERYYVNDSASLTELADKLNTTHHNLSQVLNEQKGQTFAEYLMQYRVDEARKIIREDSRKHLKIEEIALQVGYNSKSAFNTAFKRFTRMTPSEFRQLKNVRDYREERLAGRTIRDYGKVAHSFDKIRNQIDMVRNFFLIFMRTLSRNKVFTFINLFGLVIGFTSSLFIYLFISDERSYDRDIPDSEDIYRIGWFNVSPQTRTPHPMAQAMVRDFPEVKSAVTLSPWYGAGLSKQKITVKNVEKNIQFEEQDFYFVDSTFLDVFGFELISGNKETALKQPGGIVISQSMATKYFSTSDPLDKRLAIGSDGLPAEVVGVIADPPKICISTTIFSFLTSP